ncbi:ATP-binding protein [Brevibacillus brevis]|uniref:ATP-binding protein n=1 Tax=Brevibacillus brevis TaxID=1393 RepID=UPI0025A62733|nr:ATP-binding protein [Brevibacillus brevis]WJQ78967.1 ATP-binding protein [Brevibacillus brevis]
MSEIANAQVSQEWSRRPYVPKGTHPIETGRYLIATNEINRMYLMVKQWIDNRAPGAIIYGRPRLGKSRAIDYLMHDLPFEYPKIPIFRLLCRQYKNPNEMNFFENLLEDVGHQLIFRGKANVKRERLIKYLIEQAVVSGQNRIVLFVDDAQRLVEIEYGWLMDIYNVLDRGGISLTCILVGQEELIHQRTAFGEARKMQIVGRFMVHEHKFTGIMTKNDLMFCMAGYDDVACEYPEGSGWSFTRYYFPDAFAKGFRLEQCVEDLFQVFKEIRQSEGLRGPIEIPMQYVTLTIDHALRRFGINGANVDYLTKVQWEEAIKKSGYIEAERYV